MVLSVQRFSGAVGEKNPKKTEKKWNRKEENPLLLFPTGGGGGGGTRLNERKKEQLYAPKKAYLPIPR